MKDYISIIHLYQREMQFIKKRIRHKVSKKKKSVTETTSQPIFFDNSEKKINSEFSLISNKLKED